MLKRTLALCALALAVWVPSGLADSGTPGTQPTQAATPSPAPSAAPFARGNGAARLRLRLERLRAKVVRATVVFARRCTSGKADHEKCTAAAQRLLAGLKKADDRITALVGKIHDRCDGQTGRSAPKTCAHADQLVQALGRVQSRLRVLEQKLQAWLDNPAAGAGSSSTAGSDGLAPLDALAGALTATAGSGF